MRACLKIARGAAARDFGLGARRSERRIPAAGFDARDNEAPSQKSRRPEGFRAKGRLASLLLSRRPTRGMDFPSPANWFPEAELCADAHGSLLRRASPSSLQNENSTSRIFRPARSRFQRPGSLSGGISPKHVLCPSMFCLCHNLCHWRPPVFWS